MFFKELKKKKKSHLKNLFFFFKFFILNYTENEIDKKPKTNRLLNNFHFVFWNFNLNRKTANKNKKKLQKKIKKESMKNNKIYEHMSSVVR